jgi:hypothetical protein
MTSGRYGFSKYKWNVTNFLIAELFKQFLRKKIDCSAISKSVRRGAYSAMLTGPCHLKFFLNKFYIRGGQPKLVFGPQLENFAKIIGFLGRMIRKTWRNTNKMSKNRWLSILVWAAENSFWAAGWPPLFYMLGKALMMNLVSYSLLVTVNILLCLKLWVPKSKFAVALNPLDQRRPIQMRSRAAFTQNRLIQVQIFG